MFLGNICKAKFRSNTFNFLDKIFSQRELLKVGDRH